MMSDTLTAVWVPPPLTKMTTFPDVVLRRFKTVFAGIVITA
jgi:hypothetical protein